MQIIDVILIGVALSIDACALTIANCATYSQTLSKKKEWAMPVLFALSQGVMPLIGFSIGYLFKDYIGSIAKFLSAGIFFVLAIKIVYDIFKEEKTLANVENKNTKRNTATLSFTMLLIQALATSIDALAVGVTFIGLKFSVFVAVLIIATITFLLVSLSLVFGKHLGKLFGKYAEWIGALILFILALKTLIESVCG